MRVLERLKNYESLYVNNPSDPNVKKRVLAKMPLFKNMYKKLVEKRSTLNFAHSIYSKTFHKQDKSNDSTRFETKDFHSDSKSFNDNISLGQSMQSMQSLMKTMKSTNKKSFMVNESFEFCNQENFDGKLNEIKNIIKRLNQAISTL
jgi:hypothetical protein